MGIDVLSPVAPAHINTLLVPAGKIQRKRFSTFVSRLERENVVRLGDVSPDGKSRRNTFSPLAFPDGRIIYSFSVSESPTLDLDFFPFELNREAQVVLYLVDGSEVTYGGSESALQKDGHGGSWSTSQAFHSLEDEVRARHSQCRRAILHQILIFDSMGVAECGPTPTVFFVPAPEKSRSTTIKTVMCDITARFLHSMGDLAQEMQEHSTIESPSSARSSRHAARDIAERVRARMSMHGEFNQAALHPSRSSSPAASNSFDRTATPAGARSASRHSVASPNRANRLSEVSPAFGSRDASRERNSGISSTVKIPTEREKSRSAARSRIVVGALYLQAGLWPDAVKDISEGTTIARSNNDYLWHAKGLEYIIACLLMFGWAEMYFQIPQVCYPITEKPSLSKSSSATPTSSATELALYGRSSSDSRTVSLHYLTKILPDLLNSVNTLYTRALNFTQEALPQLLMSESMLRCGYLLSAMSLRNGIIDDEMLQALVSSKAIPKADPSTRSTDTIHLRKSEIATMLLKAVPAVAEDMPLNELLQISVGLASTLSMLGMDRKQAFILKELLQRIIPGLVEARKAGAAEIGIHPAAGLLTLSNASDSGYLRIEEGMKSLLTLIGAMYMALSETGDRAAISSKHSSEGVRPVSSRRTRLNANGNFDLKVDVLRSCIAICEVLPDFEGVLNYTVHLLNLSRGAITLPFHQPGEAPAISQEEQARLIDSVKRTVGAAAKVGLVDIEADYWDEFLVRSIEAMEPSAPYRVRPHSKKELQSVAESNAVRSDPFIYNPFSKQASSATDQPLIADDLAYFQVCLQNPFEVDVEINEISLLAEGCNFQPSKHSIVLGHLCCQKFTMTGTPRESGTLRIVGCKAKIRFCKQRDFHIFSKDWKPKVGSETKTTSSAAGDVAGDRPPSAELGFAQIVASGSNPGGETISLAVLNAQPLICIQSTTLSQPALMVLEGEKKSFEINLKNESVATAADLVLFTFQDSATTQLRAALTSNELSPTELYELQLQLATGSPFKRADSNEQDGPAIAAGENAVFTVEVLGIPGLVNGVVQVDYAHLGVNLSDVKDKFYTRQVTLPVAVTVNAGVEVPRCNMLPFSGDFAWWNKQRASQEAADPSSGLSLAPRSRSTSPTTSRTDNGQFMSLLARLGLGSHNHDHCLLLMDLRNVWPFPLSISMQVREWANTPSSSTNPWRRAYTVHESLQPGHVSRAVLLVPRVYVSNPHAPIPLIGSQRQFVVNASKLSVGAEEANREAFWYREELLKHVRGNWREEGTEREGTIDLRRGIRLNARMIEALKIEDLGITLSIQASGSLGPQLSPVSQNGHACFTLQTNSFATVSSRIHNRSSTKKHVLLRIQPSVRDQPHAIALDLSKRFAWTGMLQRVLHPPLAPNEVREASLGIMGLCAGKYEIAAVVEEMKVAAQAPLSDRTDASSQLKDRRIWHAGQPCMVDVIDQS